MPGTPAPLDPAHLRSALTLLPKWSEHGGALQRTFRFADFATAMGFMADGIEPIEKLGHHPEWRNIYDQVEVRLTTHEAGNQITAADVALAKTLEWLAGVRGVVD